MAGKILLTTAYLPPVEYIARIAEAGEVLIEREENYIKQSYRNRCYILSANGPQLLSVPVLLGSFHKTPVREIRIDYSKRWQQVHLGAMSAAYRSSPFFIYYFEILERIILSGHEFLLDLNSGLLKAILGILEIKVKVSYTTDFVRIEEVDNDFRYSITPKKETLYRPGKYIHVFNPGRGSEGGLSIVDLLFSTGPDSAQYL